MTWRPTESPETAWLVARDLLGLLVQGPTGRQTDLLYREQLSAIDHFRLNPTIDALIGQLLTVDGALTYSPEHTAEAIHHITCTFAFDVSITYGLSPQIQTLVATTQTLITDHNVSIRPGTRAMIEFIAALELAHAQLMAPLDPDTPVKNDDFLNISNQALASLTLIPDPLMAPHWLDSGTDIAPLIQVLQLQMECAQKLTTIAVDHFSGEPDGHPLEGLKTHHNAISGVTETMDHLITEMFTLSKKMCTLTCDSYIIFSAWNLVSGWLAAQIMGWQFALDHLRFSIWNSIPVESRPASPEALTTDSIPPEYHPQFNTLQKQIHALSQFPFSQHTTRKRRRMLEPILGHTFGPVVQDAFSQYNTRNPVGFPPFPSDQTAGLYLWWPRFSDGFSIPASGFAPENKI